MAHRPIARTDLRTKSTSTSVAYLQISLEIVFFKKKKKKKWSRNHNARITTENCN